MKNSEGTGAFARQDEVGRSDGPMGQARSSGAWSRIAIITLFWALIYVPGLFSPPMLDDVDSVHAETAKEMLTRGDFVTLHANGVRYLDKAPLLYWCTAGSYKVFGFTEFATRLPLILFVLGLLLAAYALGSEVAVRDCGFGAALVLATAIGPYLYTRFLIPDIIVGLWLTLTAHLFWKILQQERPSALLCWGIGVATALNVLTKGLIGMVFPVGIILGYLLLTGNLKKLWQMRPISTIVVFLAVAAPWHILATLRNPAQGEAKGFFWFYFINEQVYRFLNKRIPHDYDRVPLLLFWALALVWVFPWSAYLVASFRKVPVGWRKWREGLSNESRAALLFAIWALVILVFFSFSTRQEYYMLPAVPALALLTGLWLAEEERTPQENRVRKEGRVATAVLLLLGVAAFAVTTVIAAKAPRVPPGVDFAELLKSSPQMYNLSTGHLFDLTFPAMGAFRLPLLLTGFGMLAGTGLSWWFRRRARPKNGNLALAGMMVVVFYAVHLALGVFYPALGSKAIAEVVSRAYRPGDIVEIDGEYANWSSVNFYTGIQLRILNGRVNALWYGSLFPDSPKIFDDDESFKQLWLGPQRVFFLSLNAKGEEKLRALGIPAYELMHSGDKGVFSNRAPDTSTPK